MGPSGKCVTEKDIPVFPVFPVLPILPNMPAHFYCPFLCNCKRILVICRNAKGAVVRSFMSTSTPAAVANFSILPSNSLRFLVILICFNSFPSFPMPDGVSGTDFYSDSLKMTTAAGQFFRCFFPFLGIAPG